jgi:hypothetical protein
MYVDAQNLFSDAQAVTSTAVSTNVIDLIGNTAYLNNGGSTFPNLTKNLGVGEDLYLVIQTQTTCTDSGSDATVTFSLESDDNTGLSSATVHYTTGALAFAAYATAGTTVVATKLPSGSYQRYLGVRYTVASGPLTAGAFDAFLTTDISAYTAYSDNITIV